MARDRGAFLDEQEEDVELFDRAAKRGRRGPVQNVNIALDEELYRWLKLQAAQGDTSTTLTSLVNQAVYEFRKATEVNHEPPP